MAAPRPDLKIEALGSHHDRNGFSCGVDSLDRYLRTQAGQDVRSKANGVFILVEPDNPNVVLGYYTLCATGLAQGDVPAAARKLRRSLDGLTRVLAIELMTSARGIQMRGESPAPVSAAVIACLRERVPGPGPDRYLAPDITEAVALVASGALLRASGLATGQANLSRPQMQDNQPSPDWKDTA